MAQTLTIKIKGRYSHPNELSEVPDGALTTAENVNIDEESIATPRRGFDRYSYALSSGSDRNKRIFEYKDTLLVHYNDDTLARDTGAAWSDYSGTYDPPDSSTPMRAAESNENFYFTTDSGVQKLDSVTGTPGDSGVAKGLTIEATLSGASGFLANNNQVAYRVVWGIIDANDNLVLGAPSERLVVTNTAGGTRDVALTITIPAGITTSHFVQVYRSPAEGTSVEPSDELQLTYEQKPTSGEITALSMSITDNRDESILGATIYTAPSQETIANSNETPPFAKDIAVFKNHMFYLNTKTKHRLQLTILAAEGGGGATTELQVDDVVTINGVAYTGKATTTVGSNQFAVATGGTVSQNIRDTALQLVKVVNQSSSNTGANAIYAYYISGVDDTPGKILFESRSVGGAQFSITYTPNSHSGNPFTPELPSSGTDVSSANDEFKNGLSFSKLGQPEAVPLPNVFRVGSADEAGLRLVPLRDSLFVLKEDGVYRVTGEGAASFRVELFDDTAIVRAPETATTLNNAIFFLSDQGVAQCTETGISVVSRPIEIDLLEMFGTVGLSAVDQYSFAVGYETERKYILGVPTTSSDTSAKKFHIYNTFTNAWTTWEDLDVVTGHVSSVDDKLYFADSSSEYLLQERKALSELDFADFKSATTISNVSSDGLTLTLSNTDQIESGSVIYQSDTVFSIVDSVDTVAGTATVNFDGNLTAAAATIYAPITAQLQWVPVHGGNPSVMKQLREVAFMFKQSFLLRSDVIFSSDISPDEETVSLTGRGLGFWGFFTWGNILWGGAQGRLPTRTWTPQNKQKCTQLLVRYKHSLGFSDFKLSGFAAHFREISERFGN